MYGWHSVGYFGAIRIHFKRNRKAFPIVWKVNRIFCIKLCDDFQRYFHIFTYLSIFPVIFTNNKDTVPELRRLKTVSLEEIMMSAALVLSGGSEEFHFPVSFNL